MYYKKNYGVAPRTFSGLLEDMFQGGWNRIQEEVNAFGAPVNITETEKSYELKLVAPGIKKEDVKLTLDKNLLTIAYEHKEESTENTDKMLRSEYSIRSFKRTFTLNEKIDTSSISAKYADGILNISLAKKESVEQPVHEIAVN
jgi:HSP20 family protein